MDDFERAEESRERNEGLYYEEYHERWRRDPENWGEPGWCPRCAAERIPLGDDLCPECNTFLEELEEEARDDDEEEEP